MTPSTVEGQEDLEPPVRPLLIDPVDVADKVVPLVDLVHGVGDVGGFEEPLEVIAEPGFDLLEERLAALPGDRDIERLVARGLREEPLDVAVRVVEVAADGGVKGRRKGQGERQDRATAPSQGAWTRPGPSRSSAFAGPGSVSSMMLS